MKLNSVWNWQLLLCVFQTDPRLPEHGALRRLPRQHVLQQVPPVEMAGEVTFKHKHQLSPSFFLLSVCSNFFNLKKNNSGAFRGTKSSIGPVWTRSAASSVSFNLPGGGENSLYKQNHRHTFKNLIWKLLNGDVSLFCWILWGSYSNRQPTGGSAEFQATPEGVCSIMQCDRAVSNHVFRNKR